MSLGKLDKEQVVTAKARVAEISIASEAMFEILTQLQNLGADFTYDEIRNARIEELDEQYSELMQAVRMLQRHWTRCQA